MGNLHSAATLPALGVLTHWQLPEIKALFRVYWSIAASDSHLLPLQLFNYMMMKAPIAGSKELFKKFEAPGSNHARMLEFFTALTVYAWATFTNKAKCNPHLVMFKLFDFNDDNVLCYDELRILVRTVTAAIAIMQGLHKPDFSGIDAATEQLFKGNTKRVGDEMTFEEFARALETAGYKDGYLTAPDDTAERVPMGLFQRFFAKTQLTPVRQSHPSPRFSSLQNSPERQTPSVMRAAPATLRLPRLPHITSEKAVPMSKRVFVVRSTQKQQQYTPLDIHRFKERFDRLAAGRKGGLPVRGKDKVDVATMFDGVMKSETQARLRKVASDEYGSITFEQFLQLLVPQASRAQVLTMLSWVPRPTQSVFPRRVKSKFMSTYEVSNYQRVFSKNDNNQDGRLELWELKEAVKALGLEAEQRCEVEVLENFREGIGFRDFLLLVKQPHVALPEDLDV